MNNATHIAEQAMRLADELEAANDMEGAMKAISWAVDLDKKNPKYRALRGRLLHLSGRSRDAIRDLDSALALKPDAPLTLYFRARSRAMIDDLDGAIADFERSIALRPSLADAYAEIGHINNYKGNLVQAQAAYKKAMELEPERYSYIREELGEIEQKISSVS